MYLYSLVAYVLHSNLSITSIPTSRRQTTFYPVIVAGVPLTTTTCRRAPLLAPRPVRPPARHHRLIRRARRSVLRRGASASTIRCCRWRRPVSRHRRGLCDGIPSRRSSADFRTVAGRQPPAARGPSGSADSGETLTTLRRPGRCRHRHHHRPGRVSPSLPPPPSPPGIPPLPPLLLPSLPTSPSLSLPPSLPPSSPPSSPPLQ